MNHITYYLESFWESLWEKENALDASLILIVAAIVLRESISVLLALI
jgi:hypothetical protein